MKNKVEYTCCMLMGVFLGALGTAFTSYHARDQQQDIQHGAREAYISIISEIVNKRLISGPLEITEPNTTVSDCAFLVFDFDGKGEALLVGTAANNCTIIDNYFVSRNMNTVLDPNGAACLNNTWVLESHERVLRGFDE